MMAADPPVEEMEAARAPRKGKGKRSGEALYFDAELGTIIASAETTAAYFGVTQPTLSNWVNRDGCPRHKYGYYDIKAVTLHRQKMEGIGESPEEERDVEKMSMTQQKVYFETQLKSARAEAATLKTAILRGEYLKRDDVVKDLKRFAGLLKRSLQGLGRRLSREAAAHVSADEARQFNAIIGGTLDEALQQMSVDGVYRYED
jgi:phage terminase Nu1 subunit (DNA packaging protein)